MTGRQSDVANSTRCAKLTLIQNAAKVGNPPLLSLNMNGLQRLFMFPAHPFDEDFDPLHRQSDAQQDPEKGERPLPSAVVCNSDHHSRYHKLE